MSAWLDGPATGDYTGDMARMDISLPVDLQHFVDARVLAEGFADPAAYLRDLIERDQDTYEADVRRVRALVEEGIASGMVDREPEEILDEIIAEILACDD